MAKKTITMRDKTIFDGVLIKFIFKGIIKLWFKLSGWKVSTVIPEGAGITVAAPHTSNWDFIYALSAAILHDVKIYFSIKDSWCKLPVIGSIILWLGAIPIDRSLKAQGQINLIKDFVEAHKDQRIFFIFTPEGTRGKVKKWAAGFYFMAEKCNLPIFLSKADYRTKEAGVFHTYQLTGDRKTDIQAIQAAYKSVCGKFPEKQFPDYEGPLPEMSETEANTLRKMYSQTDLSVHSSDVLTRFFDKGLLEKVESAEIKYQLSSVGKGSVLHLFPVLG